MHGLVCDPFVTQYCLQLHISDLVCSFEFSAGRSTAFQTAMIFFTLAWSSAVTLHVICHFLCRWFTVYGIAFLVSCCTYQTYLIWLDFWLRMRELKTSMTLKLCNVPMAVFGLWRLELEWCDGCPFNLYSKSGLDKTEETKQVLDH